MAGGRPPPSRGPHSPALGSFLICPLWTTGLDKLQSQRLVPGRIETGGALFRGSFLSWCG
ncbi:hypothetical protein SBA4_3150046 [Candidatus Sulfopaludibacter sp. SbA4]|nr:hypothetical protein SBA4_3150046 [Candidatus Sulfopaludibacter sp. SbA4]